MKIGIGPSSSHTVGPWRAAASFIEYLKENRLSEVTEVNIELYGSLAKTGKGHGTDLAVVLGLAGEDFRKIDPNLIRSRFQELVKSGFLPLSEKHGIPFNIRKHLIFNFKEILEEHPNGMAFRARFADGSQLNKVYYSVGGGFVVEEGNQSNKATRSKSRYPCHTAGEILENCNRLNVSISDLVRLNESTWQTEAEIKESTRQLWQEMKNCMYRGVNKKGILPGGLQVKRRAGELNSKLLEGKTVNSLEEWMAYIKQSPNDFNTINNWVAVFAMAVNEENADFGRVVTAPTNGASGVIPAVLMYACCFTSGFDDESVTRFLLTAGEIGTLYKKGATISGAMGGCQAEIGVSSSMAAAGLTEALGGSPRQVLQAAEIAMEHHLGMTCDPVGGLVQIPCIERNLMGAMKAITASNLALAGNTEDARVSLDDVITAMRETALDMNSKYKETSEGGLARIPINIVEC